MSPALFILTICCYLVSMAAALIISFFSKLIPDRFIKVFIIIHFLLLFAWFLFRQELTMIQDNGNSGYIFLSFFCTGIIAAGLILRKKYALFLKVYFSTFLASLFVFLISPSRVIGFVSSGNFETINPRRIHISQNYFLIEQERIEVSESGDSVVFKIIQEMGVFHKTLAREIVLPSSVDSVRLLNISENTYINIRAYFPHNTSTDSIDLHIKTGATRDSSNIITRKPRLK